jgi:rhodanese-related sulfurtransferase
MDTTHQLRHLSPTDINRRLVDGSITLIDVREPNEYGAEHIRGALLRPLSTFDPEALPAPGATEVVFHCGTGKRSAMAVGRCLGRAIAHNAHMAGGIQAWKAAGLPVVRPDSTDKT